MLYPVMCKKHTRLEDNCPACQSFRSGWSKSFGDWENTTAQPGGGGLIVPNHIQNQRPSHKVIVEDTSAQQQSVVFVLPAKRMEFIP